MSEEDCPLLAGLWQLALDGRLVIPPDVWEAMVERGARGLHAVAVTLEWDDLSDEGRAYYLRQSIACLRAALSLPEKDPAA